MQVNDNYDDSSSDVSSDECSEKSFEDNSLVKSPSSTGNESTFMDVIPKKSGKITRETKQYSSGKRTKFYELEAGQEVSVLNNAKVDRDEIDW